MANHVSSCAVMVEMAPTSARRVSSASVQVELVPTSTRNLSSASVMIEWETLVLPEPTRTEKRVDIYKVAAYLDAGWTDLTPDVISDITIQWGISGTTPNDRMADTGIMNVVLNNYDGAYTAGESTALAGWKKGAPIKLTLTYDGEPYIRFLGVVDEIQLTSNQRGYTTAAVTAVDWMNYAAEHPIVTPSLQTNLRADQALKLLLADMPVQPVSRQLDTGDNTFPSIFDLTSQRSVCYAEMAKLVESELGYIYLRKDKNTGEQLVFEKASRRTGLTALKTIPKLTAELGYLLQEDGDKILQEDGDDILVEEVEAFTFADNMQDLIIEHGENTANRIKVTAHPRKADTSTVVLYQLGRYMQIGGGQTLTWTANYADPNGGRGCGGFDMIEPVATTDYTVNSASDGSGSNLTSSAVVSVVFGANNAVVTFKNTSTTAGYITLFKLRGKGLYTYADVEAAEEDADSIGDYGTFEREFDLPYQASTANGEVMARTSLYHDRYPRTVVRAITYCANRSSDMLMAFLNFDIGDLIKISETNMGLSKAYFIQNIAARLEKGGLIYCTYELVEHWSLLTGTMTPLEYTGATGTQDGINFGDLPQVRGTSERTFAAWVYHAGGGYSNVISAPFADGGGIYFYISGANHRPEIYSNLFNSYPGFWRTDANTVPVDEWHHVVITYDCWDIDADPVIYVDAVSKSVTETYTPAGTLNSEVGAEVVLGNYHTNTQDYNHPFDGKLRDVRIYNCILTAGEVTTLFNAGTPDASLVTEGLVFQGPVVKTEDVATYNGATLSKNLKLLDNIHQAVGTPSGAPTTAIWS